MFDRISTEDRRLIDDALASGRVTKISTKPKKRLKPEEVLKQRAKRGVQIVRDRRRFKTVPVPTGTATRTTSKDMTGTVFPRKVSGILPDVDVLKDGFSNSKIGGDVLVGYLKGAHIRTLTLEERATCPKTCQLWQTCYGNSMQWSRRWKHGPALEGRLREEVAALTAKHDQVLIRLHVLGDFYSTDYVMMWRMLLIKHPNLNLFGFTAWDTDTDIGGAVGELRTNFGRRASIRTSGKTGQWGSFTIDFPTDRKMIGDAIVCPEQRDAMNGTGRETHCGSCTACWACSAPIVFVEH